MSGPTRELIRLRRAYRMGRIDDALGIGDTILRDPPTAAARAEALLLCGGMHASQNRPGLAIAMLTEGVDQILSEPATAATPTWITGVGAPLGRRAHAFELMLIALQLRHAQYRDLTARTTRLAEPNRPMEVRFEATRAQAALLSARGDAEKAHHLLNTASGLTDRLRSQFRAALVDGDRAMVLAAQGRVSEAINAADRVLKVLVRPAVGSYQRWSNAHAAAVSTTVCRSCANTGDVVTAQRMLTVATTTTRRANDDYLVAHLQLARAIFETREGQLAEAEQDFLLAQGGFHQLGCEPGAALVALEQGRAALRRGLVASARPMLASAAATFRSIGQPREANEAQTLALHADA